VPPGRLRGRVAFRLRQAVAEENHTIQPFDQDRWAATYAAYDTQSALDVFRALRGWNVKFITAQPAEVFEKAGQSPGARGDDIPPRSWRLWRGTI